jgi:hypothetical protein
VHRCLSGFGEDPCGGGDALSPGRLNVYRPISDEIRTITGQFACDGGTLGRVLVDLVAAHGVRALRRPFATNSITSYGRRDHRIVHDFVAYDLAGC